jgi:hypothetical protein
MQGDQIGQFLLVGLLLEAHCDFLEKDIKTQRNGNILGYFLIKQIFT